MQRFLAFLIFFGVVQLSFAQKIVDFEFIQSDKRYSAIELLLDQNIPQAAKIEVFVGKQDEYPSQQVAIIGKLEILEAKVQFSPSFGFRPGLHYTAFINQAHPLIFQIPTVGLSTPTVLNVYPSGEEIPANLLKIYLHFSQPMQAGKSLEWVHLIDSRGDTLDAPFLLLQPELWNEDYTRLTLWLDPGRIKRALGPNQAQGTPLEAGQEVRLLISGEWPAQNGLKLEKEIQKSYQVLAADRRQPNTAEWQMEWPKAGSKEPILIHFGEALDHALIQKSFSVWTKEGKKLEGEFSIATQESVLFFHPTSAWEKGEYQIKLDSNLEDLAGNNLNRLFDRDLFDQNQKAGIKDYYSIPISIQN